MANLTGKTAKVVVTAVIIATAAFLAMYHYFPHSNATRDTSLYSRHLRSHGSGVITERRDKNLHSDTHCLLPIVNAGDDMEIVYGKGEMAPTITVIGMPKHDFVEQQVTGFSWFFNTVPSSSRINDNHITYGNDALGTQMSFTPDVPGVYELRLSVVNECGQDDDKLFVIVRQGEDDSNPHIDNNNCHNPIVDAGPDQEVEITARDPHPTVYLDGSGSFDPDDHRITGVSWLFQVVPNRSQLSNSAIDFHAEGLEDIGLDAQFDADVAGVYSIKLTVLNECGAFGSNYVQITVRHAGGGDIDDRENRECTTPIASAGENVHVEIGEFLPDARVVLDGSGSNDPDGDGIEGYFWSFTSLPLDSKLGPADMLGSSDVHPSFKPDVPGMYEVMLSVVNGCGFFAKDFVSVNVEEIGGDTPDCPQPEALAGPDSEVFLKVDKAEGEDRREFETVFLDGSESFAPRMDDVTSTIRWSFVRLPPHSRLLDSAIGPPGRLRASFLPDAVGVYEIQLSIVTSCNSVATDLVEAWVREHGSDDDSDSGGSHPGEWCLPPNTDPGHDQVITLVGGEDTPRVVLDARNSTDPLSKKLTGYRWRFFRVPPKSRIEDKDLSAALTPLASFTPDLPGRYKLELSIANECGAIDVEYMWVDVVLACPTPYARAGEDFSTELILGRPHPILELDGSGSGDTHGIPLSGFIWSFMRTPRGSGLTNVDISTPFASSCSFQPDIPGLYEVELTVVNECGTSNSDSIVIMALKAGGGGGGGDDGDEWEDDSDLPWDECIAPVTDCGPDIDFQMVQGHDVPTLSLDGSYSHDTQTGLGVKIIGFEWSLDRVPLGSAANNDKLWGRYSSIVSLKPDVPGVYGFTLSVENSCGAVSSDHASMIVRKDLTDHSEHKHTPGCDPPIADAGPDATLTIIANQRRPVVTLDGTISYDPSGIPLTRYRWNFMQLPVHSRIMDSDVTGSYTSIASFKPDVAGSYLVELTVINSCGEVASDDVNIKVLRDGQARDGDSEIVVSPDCPLPFVHAGEDLHVQISRHENNLAVSLDGTRSRGSEGSTITGYRWYFEGKPRDSHLTNADIGAPYTPMASFQPDVAGLYTVKLQCVNECGAHAEDTITVNVDRECAIPVPDAGPDQEITFEYSKRQLVQLSGVGSYAGTDPNRNITAYRWGFVKKPKDCKLRDTNIAHQYTSEASFYPDQMGVYTMKLTVMNDCGASAFDIMEVSMVSPNHDGGGGGNADVAGCRFPEANAGGNQKVLLGTEVVVDGSRSYDPTGNAIVGVLWLLMRRPEGTALTNQDLISSGHVNPTATFTPDVVGVYGIKFSVLNSCGSLASDFVSIEVVASENELTNDVNGCSPPVANAGSDFTAELTIGSSTLAIDLDGSISYDTQGNELTSWRWYFLRVPLESDVRNTDIDGVYSERASFTPDVAGEYEVKLTVKNECGAVGEDSVLILVLR